MKVDPNEKEEKDFDEVVRRLLATSPKKKPKPQVTGQDQPAFEPPTK